MPGVDLSLFSPLSGLFLAALGYVWVEWRLEAKAHAKTKQRAYDDMKAEMAQQHAAVTKLADVTSAIHDSGHVKKEIAGIRQSLALIESRMAGGGS